MNPVRSLGPALVLGDWTAWWAYLAGPVAGAVIAVGIAYILRGPGGGTQGTAAAQGTLGTLWLPERIGPPMPAPPEPPDPGTAASGPAKGAVMKGYVVVFEGDDESGYSAYSPDLPGVAAAGATRQETEDLMVEAMAEHIGLLRQAGQPVPEPAEADSVTILDPAAA